MQKVERIFVVPLRKARRGSSSRFAKKAVRYLRSFVARHMKAKEVKVGTLLNEFIWSRGIRNPPRRVEVKAIKIGDTAFVELVDAPEEAWKKILPEEEVKEEKPKEKKAEKKEVSEGERREEKKIEEREVKEKPKRRRKKREEEAKEVLEELAKND